MKFSPFFVNIEEQQRQARNVEDEDLISQIVVRDESISSSAKEVVPTPAASESENIMPLPASPIPAVVKFCYADAVKVIFFLLLIFTDKIIDFDMCAKAEKIGNTNCRGHRSQTGQGHHSTEDGIACFSMPTASGAEQILRQTLLVLYATAQTRSHIAFCRAVIA
jgi:hypothetical protein